MRLVVADTGPLNYLVQISEIELLPQMFEAVLIPDVVREELSRARAPRPVRAWIAKPPNWVGIASAPAPVEDLPLPGLDDGERSAIALALARQANAILMDDRAGVAAALASGLEGYRHARPSGSCRAPWPGRPGRCTRAAENNEFPLPAGHAGGLLMQNRKDRGQS